VGNAIRDCQEWHYRARHRHVASRILAMQVYRQELHVQRSYRGVNACNVVIIEEE
jgi:hypothetical protein